jgi:predicted dehydrogenase
VERAGESLGIADTSTDWEAFVRRDDLDLVSICTPVGMHAAQAVAAVEAGKHVLVEKPVALDADEARRMLDAATTAGVAHAICFEGRYDTERARVRQLVEEGVLGTPFVAQASSVADYWHPTRGLQSEWMYSVAEGGGYLMGMASHDIDYLSFLFGDPEEVCADVRSSVPRRSRSDGTELAVDADDTSVVLIRTASGALATVSTSVVALHRNRRELELFGSDGTIVIEGGVMTGPPRISVAHVGDEGLRPVEVETRMPRSGAELPRRRAAEAIRSLAILLEEWLPAFDGRPTPGVPTLVDGVRVQDVVDAARRSSAGAGWVRLA